MIAIYKNDLINVLRKFKQELDDGQYVPAEEGKGLSTNDYTTAEKQKLASLPAANDIVIKVTGKDLSTNDFTNSYKDKLDNLPASIDLSNYVLKVTGKDLSTNDYTTAEKLKLEELPAANQIVLKETGKGLTSNDYTSEEKAKLASLPAANEIVLKETGKMLSDNNYSTAEKTKLAAVPTPSTISVLDANGKVPVANLPAEFTALETVATYADLPITGLFDGRRVMVLDASGDPTVVSGFAVYVYSSTTTSWTKILEGESMDVSAIVDWSNIQNKPSDLLHETDIVDGLTSTSTTDALSANQGKELKGLIDGLGTAAYSASTDFAASNHNHDSSYISAVAEGTANGTIKVTKNGSDSDISVHGLQSGAYQKIEVVSALPASPDSDTLYFVLE